MAITDELVGQIRGNVDAARVVARCGRIPAPLVDSPKCPRCSLVTICLPDETLAAAGFSPEDLEAERIDLFAGGSDVARVMDDESAEVRRLLPARDDLRPLYCVAAGALRRERSGDPD